MSRKLRIRIGILTGVFVAALAASSTALAEGTVFTRSGELKLGTTGVVLQNGIYHFYPQNINHGGFAYSGDLEDTRKDGNSVFIHSRVEAYPLSDRIYNKGGKGTRVPVHEFHYPGDQFVVHDAFVQVCQDRGSFAPDLCHGVELISPE